MLVLLLGRGTGRIWCFIFLIVFFIVLDFSLNEVEDLRLPPEEVWVTEDVLAGVFATFVEAIHVKLSYERVDISVSEVFGEDVVLEVIDLFDGEFPSVGHPVDDRLVVLVLQYFK